MTTSTFPALTARFKIAWIIILTSAALATISYLVMIFVDKGAAFFTPYTAFNLYGFLVLLIPFRRGQKWAWWSTWILPTSMALTGLYIPEFAPYYFGGAAVFAVGLLLTIKDFFSTNR